MAIVKNLIPTNRKQGEKSVLIDDFFDPLFNRRAKEQIRNTYGVDGLFTPVYGYAEFLDNTFFPNESRGWGPLGPAMGVLGGFGRTLDKAEDFILGGITEGTNAINQINPLSSTPNVQVHNPLSQVFIEDDDYTGEKLLAAMANNMGRLAGNTAVSEQDFDGTWKPTALGIELATDPGIFGGFLAKSATNSSAKSIGQLLSDYDDILARGAWDVTIPGARPFIKNHLGNIRQLLAANTATPYQNVNLKNLSAAGKSRDEFVNAVLEEQIYNANARWQNTMQAVQELSKTFDNIPEVTKQLRSQLDEIEKNVKLYGKFDDDFVNTVNDIRLRLDDIDKYIADPKQFNTELFDTAPMTETVNNSLTIKDFNELATANDLSTRASQDINEALGTDKGLGIILSDSGEAKNEYINAVPELSDLDYEALNSELADYLKSMSSNPGHELTLKYPGVRYMPKDKFEKVLEGDYFEDAWATREASIKAKELIRYTPRQKHLVKFTTSAFKNSNSEIGNEAVKILQSSIDLKKLDAILTNPNTGFLYDWADPKDIKYIQNNINKLHGAVKKNVSNLDKLDAAEAIINKLDYMIQRGYNIPNNVHDYVDVLKESYAKVIKTAKYGIGDYNIRETIRTWNNYMQNYKDFWNIDNYALVKQHFKDIDSPVDLMLDRSFKTTIKEAITHNPKYAGHTIRDMNQLLDVLRRRMDYSINPLTRDLTSFQKGRQWLASLDPKKGSNKALSGNIYAKLGFNDLNPLEQDFVKYINKKYNLNGIYKNIDFNAWDYNLIKSSGLRGLNVDAIDAMRRTGIKLPLDTSNITKQSIINNLQPPNKLTDTKTLQQFYPYLRNQPTDIGAAKLQSNFKYDYNPYVAPTYRLSAKAQKDNIFKEIKYNGLSDTLNYKNVDDFLISPPVKEAPKESVVLPDLDEQMKIGKEKAVDASLQKLSEIPDDAFAKYVFKVKDLNTDMQLATIAKRLQESGIPEEEQRTLFKIISEQMQVPNKVSRGEFPTLQTKRVQDALNKTLDIQSRYGIDPNNYDAKKYAKYAHDTSQYFQYLDSLNGDVTKADSFLDELFESGGIFIRNLDKTANKAEFDALRKDLMHNIVTINKLSKGKDPILKLVEQPIEGNKYALGVMLNLDNKKAVVDYAKLNIPDGALKDIIWEAPNEEKARLIKEAFDKSGAKFTFDEMDKIFDDTRKASEDFSRMIGYEKFSPNYFMHTMSYSDHAERYLGSKVYYKIDTEKLADMANEFQNYRKVGYQHAFNIKPISRKLRGSIESWNTLAKDVNIFSVNPHEITKRTFTDGLFKDANFQNHVGMFFNPNFRISSYAENIDDLKDILFARNGKGELTGNLDNLVLASPKYNEAGRLIGYQQYNKFDDKSLQRALKNPETVLLPTHALAPLDKILRKDLKMSNKVYAFINKYFTIPVKFGTLTNLGFLTGNVGDAYLKQAITMSEKYGTSVAYELARNAESVKNVVVLNNRFDSVFTKYVADMEKAMGKDKFIDYYRLTDSLISTPKAKLNFEEWLDKSVASGKITTGDRNVSRLWLYLNNYEQVMTGDFQNLGDLLEMQSKSEYAKPLNPAEKVVNKAVNIKPTKKIMWASGKVEEYARAAEILNDLTRHYSSKEIYQILGDPEKFAKEFEMMNVRMSEALNTMNTSNFNYEYLNDVLDSFGSLVPFPTFVTKNFAYWLDIMVNKPEIMDTIINMQNVAWRGKDTSSDQFQAEAKGRGAIPLKASKNSQFLKGIFKPTPYQSMFGAFDLMQNPVENLAFRVNPIATPITHHLQKPENDKYRPYSFDPYEKNIKRGDSNYSALKATFHRLNPYDRTLQNWLRLPANMGQKTAQISNVLPSVFQPDFSKTSASKNKKR